MDITLELMKHSTLEGDRIFLRPVGLADAPDMFEYASDEETTRFVFETHRDRAMTEEAIANYFLAAPAGYPEMYQYGRVAPPPGLHLQQ